MLRVKFTYSWIDAATVVALAGILAGLMASLAAFVLHWLPGHLASYAWWFVSIAAVVIAYGVVSVAFCVAFSRLSQSKGASWIGGFCFGCAFLATQAYAYAMQFPDMAAATHWIMLVAMPIYALTLGAAAGLFNLIVVQAVRALGYRIISQTGDLCWTCGYIVGKPPASARCPECGMSHPPQDAVRRRQARARRTRLAFRWMLGCAAGIAALTFAIRIVPAWVRGQALAANIAAEGRPHGIPMLKIGMFNGQPAMNGAWETLGLIKPVASDSRAVIAICRSETPEPDQPPMQLQLLAKVDGLGGPMGDYGNMYIVCDLTAEEAKDISDHGIPQPLVDEMLRVARDAGWSPNQRAGSPRLQMIVVDPHPYFAKDGSNATRRP